MLPRSVVFLWASLEQPGTADLIGAKSSLQNYQPHQQHIMLFGGVGFYLVLLHRFQRVDFSVLCDTIANAIFRHANVQLHV